MDGGPFRVSRPTERRVAERSEPAHRVEPSQAVKEEPVAQKKVATHQPREKKKPISSFILILVAVVFAVAGFLIGAVTLQKHDGSTTAIDSSKYQAVFFTNGQVYFGKLASSDGGYLKLSDVFYLQSQADTANDTSLQKSKKSGTQLIKLGSEIHGPEDEMIISKDQILFYENLKSDGKVTESIEKYKKQ